MVRAHLDRHIPMLAAKQDLVPEAIASLAQMRTATASQACL
jgi:hypothetical protein